jgi:metacaspase-1
MVNSGKWVSILENVADITMECCQAMDEHKKTKQQQQNQQNQAYNNDDNNSVVASNNNSNSNSMTDSFLNQLDDGSSIPLSTCTGNKKSLFIGINYFNSKSELRGCINDVKNIKQFVVSNFNFPTDSDHMRTLVDDDPTNMPTRANILSSMKWLVQNAKSGDSLFLHYSGHGGSQKDTNSDEEDGMDETLIPVDYEKTGIIVDNDLFDILVANLPKGVRLTCIMDCCHSGSILDLPYTYGLDSNNNITEKDNRKALIQAAIKAGMLFVQGNKKAALMTGVQAIALHFKNRKNNNNSNGGGSDDKDVTVKNVVADIIQFSGCRDNQTSADATIGGEATGAMSWSFIEAFSQNGPNQTYVQLLGNIRKQLNGKYSQVPQMSTGHRMNLDTSFKM